MLKATHQGEIKMWDVVLPCAVLEDGTRVLTQTAVFKAFGRLNRDKRGSKFNRCLNSTRLTAFIDAKNFVPYMDKELIELMQTIVFAGASGGRHTGY